MREAVIVSAARTPIGKAYRGAFNNTAAPTLASYSIKEAVERAGIDPKEVEDVVLGCAQQQGSQAINIGRLAGIAAGLSLPSISIVQVVFNSHLPFFLYCTSVKTFLARILLFTGTASINLTLSAP